MIYIYIYIERIFFIIQCHIRPWSWWINKDDSQDNLMYIPIQAICNSKQTLPFNCFCSCLVRRFTTMMTHRIYK